MDFSFVKEKMMKLIVGLGNPGIKYKKTRHNIGFMFTDELAEKLNIKFSLVKNLKSNIATTTLNGEKIIIAQPQTFMNLSGEATKLICNYYQISPSDVLVIYDDLDLPVAKVRIRPNGSSGGHKGMQNIIDLLRTNEIKRIRIGISGCDKDQVIDYVLGKFNKEEAIDISITMSQALPMVECFLQESFENFMNRYNG